MKRKQYKSRLKPTRQNLIAKYAARAEDVLRKAEQSVSRAKQQGKNVRYEEWLDYGRRNINNILKKQRYTDKDVELIKEMGSRTYYDQIKIEDTTYGRQRISGAKTANTLNKSLKTAVEIYPVRNQAYTNYLEPLMQTLLGDKDYLPEARDENEFFKVSPNYTGKPEELYKFVEFKQIPNDNDKAQQFAESINLLDWSSWENYQKRLDDINHRKYLSNIGSMPDNVRGIDVAIESIINSSAAWHIVGKDVPYNQLKSNWLELRQAVSLVKLHGDDDLLNQVMNMIEHEVDFNIIINFIDNAMMNIMRS